MRKDGVQTFQASFGKRVKRLAGLDSVTISVGIYRKAEGTKKNPGLYRRYLE